jgi:hypothetical protein
MQLHGQPKLESLSPQHLIALTQKLASEQGRTAISLTYILPGQSH